MKRRDKFDYIMIETTGMADPGPVAQTFFMDDEIGDALSLDGVVTLVDAKHVVQHIDDSDEVKEQIAFADVILLNKTDLVTTAELDQLEVRIHAMNAAAKVYRTTNSEIEIASQSYDCSKIATTPKSLWSTIKNSLGSTNTAIIANPRSYTTKSQTTPGPWTANKNRKCLVWKSGNNKSFQRGEEMFQLRKMRP